MARRAAVPRVEWRALAIDEPDSTEFARRLQGALQKLSDESFHIMAQYPRGSAQIILASRQVMEDPQGLAARPTVPAPSSKTTVTSRSAEEQFIYHYRDPMGATQERPFTSMVEALRVVREHDSRQDRGYLVWMGYRVYEGDDLDVLLAAHADEIASQSPPKQVD